MIVNCREGCRAQLFGRQPYSRRLLHAFTACRFPEGSCVGPQMIGFREIAGDADEHCNDQLHYCGGGAFFLAALLLTRWRSRSRPIVLPAACLVSALWA